jgi:hypothetical protein
VRKNQREDSGVDERREKRAQRGTRMKDSGEKHEKRVRMLGLDWSHGCG